MTDETKLMPCPFCGEADQEVLMVEHMEGTVRRPAYRVVCDNCGASSGYSDRGDHVKMWNTRAALAASHPADPVTKAGCCQPVKVKPSPDEHYDDYCIRQFAKLMSEKMAASRAKGRSGWYDPERCSIEYLRSLLYEHLDKGDPVDVANFCMMLRHYEASTYREFCNCTPQPSPDVAAKVQALVDAATKAKIILAEFEPYPLPVLGELLAALAALKDAPK